MGKNSKSKSAELKLEAGARVRVRSWKRDGIISEVLKNGQYRVALGSLSVQCKANDLEAALSKKTPEPNKSVLPARSAVTVREIDLHGKTVAQACELLEQALNQAIMSGCRELQIIHGHGSGKIKEEVHRLLSSIDVVKEFRLSEMNSGVTRAFL